MKLICFAIVVGLGLIAVITSPAAADDNVFVQTNLVANDSAYNPQIVDASMIDAWGIALRPPGAGGHIWISNAAMGTSSEYIGDVNGIPLHQDGLKTVTLDIGGFADRGVAFVTGQVYNAASDLPGQAIEFPVSGPAHDLSTNPAAALGTISGSSKFVFATEDGTLNAWRSSTAAAMDTAIVAVDYSKTATFPYAANSVFTGVAMTVKFVPLSQQNNPAVGNHLFATDFRNNAIEVFDNQWNDITTTYNFEVPSSVEDLQPFNIMNLGGHLFVAYAKWNPDGDEGFEDTPGFGHIVEYNENGSVVRDFNSANDAEEGGYLNSPWGMAIAPAGFGVFGGDLLVANFGDGSISAFDLTTGNFVDQLRDAAGEVISIEGLWGLAFGNGVSLGNANSLYFTAGPNAEQDGLFGRLSAVPEPVSVSIIALAGTAFLRRSRARV